jgi:hypothetical protein
VSSCAFVGGDAVSDLAQYGATFAVDNSINDVAHRLRRVRADSLRRRA